MDLLETIVAELGNTELEASQIAENIQAKLGQFMIPKGVYNALNEKYKLQTDETNELRTTLSNKELELENIATANMTEQERMKHDLDKANQLIAQKTLESNKLNATNKLQKAGFTDVEIENILKTYVTDDETQTNNLIDVLVSTIGSRVEASVQDKVDAMLEESTRVDGQTEPGGNKVITIEQFRKLNIQDRQKLFTEQPEVYAQLTNGS